MAEVERLKERIEALEQRVHTLEEILGKNGILQKPGNSDSNLDDVPTSEGKGYLNARYWIGKVDPFSGEHPEPRSTGRVKVPERLILDPVFFGLENNHIFSRWRNPARYPVAAVSLKGWLVKVDSPVELYIRLQPVAEGGAGRSSRMRVRVQLDSVEVLDTGLTNQRDVYRISLPAADKRELAIEVLAQGEGVGPSPTRSAVVLRLLETEYVGPQPLSNFVVPH